jgi:SAM-dependent methyltransferase
MESPSITHLTATEVAQLDPYVFLAVLGKRVIHPGGRRSSEELFRRADFQPDQQVLDVGCGVGTSAIAIARRFGAKVSAVDISPIMLTRARSNAQRAVPYLGYLLVIGEKPAAPQGEAVAQAEEVAEDMSPERMS